MRVGDEEQLDLGARLVESSPLSKARGQEAARAGAVGFLAPKGLDGCIVLAGRILCLAERQVIPVERKGVEPKRLAYLLQAFVDPAGEHRYVGERGPDVGVVRVELYCRGELRIGFGEAPLIGKDVGQDPTTTRIL